MRVAMAFYEIQFLDTGQGNRILFLGKTEKNTFEDVRGH